MDAEKAITLLLWPAIGLISWWATADRPEPRGRWLLVYLVFGPLMLVVIAWHFVTAPARARAESRAPGGGPGPSAPGPIGQVDGQEDVAAGLDPARRRRGRRRR